AGWEGALHAVRASADVGPRRLVGDRQVLGLHAGTLLEPDRLRQRQERAGGRAVGYELLVQVGDARRQPVRSEELRLLVDDDILARLDAEAIEQPEDGARDLGVDQHEQSAS